MTENNFQIDSAAVSDRGLSEKRPQNEDSFLEVNERGLFAVADGVGGAQAGDVASQMAIEILGEAFGNLRASDDAEDLMKLAIERANEAIFQMSHDLPQLATMATTIVALHLDGNIATIGHVGDSRIYRLDGRGNLFRETQDHSMVEEEVRAGRMTANQAATHPSRNIISRALGAEQTVEVDLKTIMFEPQATFLLCSDGITRHIDDFEIRELLQSDLTSAEICRRMKEICYERGAEDNLTAVIAKISGVGQPINENSGQVFDYEESTVATVKPEYDSKLKQDSADELPVYPLQMPDKSNSAAEDVDLTDEILTPKPPVRTNLIVPTENSTAQPEIKKIPLSKDEKTFIVEDKNGGGKILTWGLMLLIGGVIGAGLTYFISKLNPPPEVPQIVQQQTPNIPYSAFEDNRRNVDRNPEQYIFATNNRAESAEDYYLLGRANLLTGKYPEAKIAFEEAKNRLAQASEINSKILANEIAMGLAIVNDEFAKKAFTKDMQLNRTIAATPDNTNSVVNSNSANKLTNSVNANRSF